MKNRAILILFSILGMGKGALAETVNEFTSLTTFSVIDGSISPINDSSTG